MPRFQSEEAYWDHVDDLFYADQESFDAHYADEIDGRIEPPVDDVPPFAPAIMDDVRPWSMLSHSEQVQRLQNAPGQLRLNLGGAY